MGFAVIVLDLRTLADEWQERLDELGSNVPDTEGMSWGELAEATEAFLQAPEQVAYVARYVELCEQLGVEPTPGDLRWWADQQEPTLIHEDSFTEYAQELAEEIGAISSDAQWPLSYIDWERAADALQMDYTTVEYDGATYYVRS